VGVEHGGDEGGPPTERCQRTQMSRSEAPALTGQLAQS
jgi:hypothetical protein